MEQTAEQRARAYRKKTIIRAAVIAAILSLLLSSLAVRRLIAAVSPLALNLVFLIVMQVVQFVAYFGGLMYFLSGTKVDKIMPGDARTVKLDDYVGQPTITQRTQQLARMLNGQSRIKAMGGELPRGILLIGGPGTGKCVAAGSLVVTESGSLPIEALHPGRKAETAYQMQVGMWSIGGLVETSHFYCGGEQETRVIEVRHGYRLECTPEHPLLSIENGTLTWVQARDVVPGTFLAINRSRGGFGTVSVPDAYLLGLLTGDGHITSNSTIILTSADAECVACFREFAQRWPSTLFETGCYGYRLASVEATQYLRDRGLSTSNAYYKTVPPAIMQAHESDVAAFLRGLFDADGYAAKTGYVEYTSTSRQLTDQVQQLLLRFGIVANRRARSPAYRHKEQRRKGHCAYYLTLTGPDARLFYERIGFGLARKQEGYHRLPQRHNTNDDVVPGVSCYMRQARYRRSERCPSYEMLEREADPNEPTIQWLLKERPFWDKVEAASTGRAAVYDVTVPGTRCFVANGFYAHNSYLAQCLAGEVGVPFMLLDSSGLVSMWLGMGSIKVIRFFASLHSLAKKYGAAVAFLDEIDAIGTARGGVEGQGAFGGMGGGGMWGGGGMGVLNTILSRMDGLDQPPGLIGTLRRKLYGWLKLPLPKLNYSILVMAATNRPGVLDAALTRAGRFDEQWRIEPPSEVNLRQVIVYYLAKVKHSESIDVNRLAAVLRGATPAEVRTAIVKKATGKAELDGRDEINESDIYWGALEALIGLDAPTLEPNLGDQKAIAWHEAGHAILLTALFPELKGQLATIVPHTGTGRGGPTLGMVIPGFKEERQSLPIDFLMRRLLMSMAGREATSLLSKGTTRTHMGFGGDRVNMQNALRGLIAEGAFGYSASLLAKSTDPLEGLAKPTNRQVDRLLDYAAATTRRILRDNITALSALANLLLEQGTLTADRLEAFSAEYPIEDISDDVIVGLIEAIEMEEEDVESTVEED